MEIWIEIGHAGSREGDVAAGSGGNDGIPRRVAIDAGDRIVLDEGIDETISPIPPERLFPDSICRDVAGLIGGRQGAFDVSVIAVGGTSGASVIEHLGVGVIDGVAETCAGLL